MNKVVVNIQVLGRHIFSFFIDKHLKVAFLDRMVDVCLLFKKLKGRLFKNLTSFLNTFLSSPYYVQRQTKRVSPNTHE